MKLLYRLLAAVLAVAAVLFALSNRQAVELALWPLPYAATVPVYAVILAAFAAGFFCGGWIAWLRGHGARRAARLARAREREIATLRERLRVAERADGPGHASQERASQGRASPGTDVVKLESGAGGG